MTRRASSRADSSRSSSSPRTGRSNRTGRAGRADGKVDVFCPQCGQHYRIDQENLEVKVECSQCHRTFYAKTAAGKRPRPKDYSKAYLGFGLLAVFMVGSFLLIKGLGGPTEAAAPRPASPPPVETGALNPRVSAVIGWANAIRAGDTFNLRERTDLAAMQRLFEVSPGRDLPNTTGTEREELERAVLAGFQNHEAARYLRDLECTHGMLIEESMATAPQGSVRLFLSPLPDSKLYKQTGRCEMRIEFRMEGNAVRVTGWAVELKPREVPQLGKDTYIPHEKIARPQVKESEFAGQKGVVTESEPIALEHLAETPEAMRKEIDKAVADILRSADPTAPGGLDVSAMMRLKRNQEIRRAATPRLLNAMYENYQDPVANNLKLNALSRALEACTGTRFLYPVSDTIPGVSQEQLKQQRQSSVKQAFAYWYKYHKHPNWDELIEKEESLDKKPAEPPKEGAKPPAKK